MDTPIGTVKVGDVVEAFHPGMFGVIKTGEVVKVGSKYVTIDFHMFGTRKVTPRHLVTLVELAER